MRALYLDASAFVKTILMEPESGALRKFLRGEKASRVSSALLRAEALRAGQHEDPETLEHVRLALRKVGLLAIDDRILETAGILEAEILRTLDAIHLATALALGDDLQAILTYDRRMQEGASILGLPVSSPQ